VSTVRDHRAISARLCSRWGREARRSPEVVRIFTGVPVAQNISIRHLYAHTHVGANFSSTAHHLHRSLHRLTTVTTKRPRTSGRLAVAQVAGGRHTAPVTPTAAAVARAATADRSRDHRVDAVNTTRSEVRPPAVSQVVPRPAKPVETESENQSSRGELPRTSVPRPVEPLPLRPTPADLSVITNQVLTEIDRRLIAHNERRGRG
jgi:hypothetical protein